MSSTTRRVSGSSGTSALDCGSGRIYRGDRSTLPLLLNASADSCHAGAWYGQETTGPGALTNTPAPGELFWYLVVGENCDGEGPAGDATVAARVLDSMGCTGKSLSTPTSLAMPAIPRQSARLGVRSMSITLSFSCK